MTATDTHVRVADAYGITTVPLADLSAADRADYAAAVARLDAQGMTAYVGHLVHDTAHGGWVAVLTVDDLIATYLD